jgi:hypothetical protein
LRMRVVWCVLLTAGRADGYLGVEDVFAVRWLEGVTIRWC